MFIFCIHLMSLTPVFTFFAVASPVVQFQSDRSAGRGAKLFPTENDELVEINSHGGNLSKRMTVNCALPSNVTAIVHKLNTSPYVRKVMDLSFSQSRLPTRPSSQPATCPGPNDTWWPGTTENLRSNCPWKYSYVDLGESYFPRYIRDASCLCIWCVKANAMGCQKRRQEVTVLHRVACKDGLAVLNNVKLSVTVDCYCAWETGANTLSVLGPPPTD